MENREKFETDFPPLRSKKIALLALSALAAACSPEEVVVRRAPDDWMDRALLAYDNRALEDNYRSFVRVVNSNYNALEREAAIAAIMEEQNRMVEGFEDEFIASLDEVRVRRQLGIPAEGPMPEIDVDVTYFYSEWRETPDPSFRADYIPKQDEDVEN